MRKQFVATIENLMSKDSKLYLLLGDIGVFNFNKVLTQYNNRAKNIGILEQSSVSLSSGIAQEGMIPVLHTIAPFIVERAYEQIKIDLGYQELGCKLVSVGGSYDYAALGCTHHCPADVGALLLIPNIEIVIPGTAKEFDILFRNSYSNGNSTYYRLSENSNLDSINIKFGKGNLIKEGNTENELFRQIELEVKERIE
jgi:transketolase